MARVSAEPIGVKSLPEKSLLLRFPIQATPSKCFRITMDHDFVIEACWRNKLKDRPN
jgi:hypothetical protein